MALTPKFIDSCNHYATAHLTRKYTTQTGSPTIAAGGRNGGKALTVQPATASNVTLTLDAQACFLLMGAFDFTAFASNSAFLRAMDGGTIHLELKVSAAGVLSVARAGTELANSGAVAISTATSYHIAFAGKIDDSGSYDVWLNGVKVITGTGDTRNGGNASANSFMIGWNANPGAMAFNVCDIAIYNGASYTDADFPGDCRAMLQNTAGPGAHSDWTGAYTDVDDATPDDDTTALTDATPGNISTFAMSAIAGTGDVKARQLVVMARKDDSGSRTIAAVERLGSTDVVGATQATGLTYVAYREISTAKPGGGAWTITDCNNAEVGVKTVA